MYSIEIHRPAVSCARQRGYTPLNNRFENEKAYGRVVMHKPYEEKTQGQFLLSLRSGSKGAPSFSIVCVDESENE